MRQSGTLGGIERPPVVVHRHDSALGRWEMARVLPERSLRPYVSQYVGWIEHMAAPLCRRELPTDEVPVIINFGAPVRVWDAGESTRYTDLGSFAAGAYDTFVRVTSMGASGGIQINFTLLGARLFLGRPLRDLANRSVALEDLFGADATRLTMQLHEAGSWNARFDLLDREIGARFSAARAPADGVLWTWRRIVAARGRVRIGAIVAEVGWSQKHLIARFSDEIGLTPKTLARVLRFARAAETLRRGGASLADLAIDCGYYDQAHFTRDFRAFAGVTPTELVASLLPDGGGIRS